MVRAVHLFLLLVLASFLAGAPLEARASLQLPEKAEVKSQKKSIPTDSKTAIIIPTRRKRLSQALVPPQILATLNRMEARVAAAESRLQSCLNSQQQPSKKSQIPSN
ncbi:F11U8 [Hyposoter didymator ichnovirus]|nr:F11U8 [Hyposoter didymator ichnovirus]